MLFLFLALSAVVGSACPDLGQAAIVVGSSSLPSHHSGVAAAFALGNSSRLFQPFAFTPSLTSSDYVLDAQTPEDKPGVRDTVIMLYDAVSCELLQENDDHPDNGFGRGGKLSPIALVAKRPYLILVGPREPAYSPDADLPVYLTVTRSGLPVGLATARPTAYPTKHATLPTPFPTVSWAPTAFPTTSKINRADCEGFSDPTMVFTLPLQVPFTIKSYIGFQPSFAQAFYCSVAAETYMRVFRFRAPNTGRFSFDTSARFSMPTGGLQTYDTVLQLVSANSCEKLACNDDSQRMASRIEYSIAKHEEVYVMVKPYASSSLDFTLTVDQVLPTAPTIPPASLLQWTPNAEPGCDNSPVLKVNLPTPVNTSHNSRRRKLSCGSNVDKTMVFQFTPRVTGTYRFEASPSTAVATLVELRESDCSSTPSQCSNAGMIEAYLGQGSINFVLARNAAGNEGFNLTATNLAGSFAPTQSPTTSPDCDLPPLLLLSQPVWLNATQSHLIRDLTCGMFLPTTVFQFTAPFDSTYRIQSLTTPAELQGDTVIEVRTSCLEHFCLRTEETCEQSVLQCNDVDLMGGGGEMAAISRLDLKAGQRVFVLVSSAKLDYSQVGVMVTKA
ncbi:hypothetical protein BASA81_000639 [Batrachochytrium salamandrivorans]|nr:hypothetical protein BASA81_000639 [Batrachochytrium salamandrivorans]